MASLRGSKYLSIIDAGISNLWSLSLPAHLESLNLHANQIEHISNVGHLRQLEHLDLSANHIAVIDNLDKLTSLKTLNLSCNMVTSLNGLSSLRSLERLDLSYNQIEDLQDLSSCGKLTYLNLNGNKLTDVNVLVRCLSRCANLRHLILAQDGSSNPLCQSPDYISKIRQSMPQLSALNDTDVSGNVVTENAIAAIPGLEAFLDFLLTSNDVEQSTQETSKESPKSLLTPKIDAVMEQFKQRYGSGSESISTSSEHHKLSSSNSEVAKQLDNMHLSNSPSSKSNQKTTGRKVYKLSRYSESSGEDELEPVRDSVTSSLEERNRLKKRSPLSAGGRKKSNLTTKRIPSKERRPESSQPADKKLSQKPSSSRVTSKVCFQTSDDRKSSFPTSSSAEDAKEGIGKTRPDRDDAKIRAELETGYKELMSSLQLERERRWKAEQATRRMADILQQAKSKFQASDDMKTSALEATIQLKQAILNENEANRKLTHQVSCLQAELDAMTDKLSQTEKESERRREALRIAESTLAQREGEEVVERAHQSKKLQVACQRASAMTREAELVRHALDASKVKVEQLQETLASREQQHREDLKNRYSLNSPELQEVIQCKVKQVEKQQQGELLRHQERVEQLSRQYSDLENEFRQALTMEETRFRELKLELEAVNGENVDNKQMLLAAQRKDETSTNIIAELSALVKEQKGRITELAKAKQEVHFTHKERADKLEDSLEEARRQLTQLESAKQAKSRLQATVQAQESVIEGLKAERKLWGKELAQQGASLAQDRGRLESQIETYSSEVAVLKKQLEREADCVKIKTKMIEDQTETIRKLKEAVVERDLTIKETREDNLASQKDSESQMAELKAALEESRDQIDRTSARKEELKHRVADLEAELQDSKDSHSTLSARWKEKSELIGQLEQQVSQMRNNWSQKEAKMAAERDMALQQAKLAVDKLKSADEAFRQQLDLKEAASQERIRRLEEEKLQEVDLANQKVALVEEEMRDLLRENDASKRTMETKMKKLTQALGDLQSDLL